MELVDSQEATRPSPQDGRRARSAGPALPLRQLTKLEQDTVDSLNGLLGQTSPKKPLTGHLPLYAQAIKQSPSSSFLRELCLEGWDCDIQCGIFKAGVRADWVVENCGLSLHEARLQVMREFPTQFGRPRSFSNSSLSTVGPEDWDCEEFCGGDPSKDRADWLVENRGMLLEAAKVRVMQEFPLHFGRNRHKSGICDELLQISTTKNSLSRRSRSPTGLEGWDCDRQCGIFKAGERATWVVEHCSTSLHEARLRVMREFPAAFGRPRSISNSSLSTVCPEDWDCEEFCGGRPSRDRVETLVKNYGMSEDAAQLRVMQEFPTRFRQRRNDVSEEQSPEQGFTIRSCSPAVSCTSLSATHLEKLDCDSGPVTGQVDELAETLVLPLDSARLRVMQEFTLRNHSSEKSSHLSQAAPECKGDHAQNRLDIEGESSETCIERPPITMMIRNIPYRYKQQELMEELEGLGFEGSFDFFFTPTDFSSMRTLGYAFINFVSAEWAMRCQNELEGHIFAKYQQKSRKKVAAVSAARLQGFQPNLRHYKEAFLTKRAVTKRSIPGPIIKTHDSRMTEDMATMSNSLN